MYRKFQLIREVTTDECSWLDRNWAAGEVVYEYSGYTYGCISPGGVAISEKVGEGPFIELPQNALIEL